MRIVSFVLMLPMALAGSAVAQHPATVTKQESVSTVVKEFQAARQALFQKLRAEEDEEKQRRIYEAEDPTPRFVQRMWKAIGSRAASDEGFEGLAWIVENGKPAASTRALAAIAEHHLRRGDLSTVLQTAAALPTSGSFDFLKKVLEKSLSRKTKGLACYSLGSLHRMAIDFKNYLEDEQTRKQARTMLGEATVQEIMAIDRARYEQHAIAYLERTRKEFADITFQHGTLGEAAKKEIFELQNLSPGKVAPEIEGEDIDGVTFKLSDYRGKVVFLDFWGDW